MLAKYSKLCYSFPQIHSPIFLVVTKLLRYMQLDGYRARDKYITFKSQCTSSRPTMKSQRKVTVLEPRLEQLLCIQPTLLSDHPRKFTSFLYLLLFQLTKTGNISSFSSCQLQLDTFHWHLPFTSKMIKSCSAAAAEPQHPMKAVQSGRINEALCDQGNTSEDRFSDSQIFSGANFMSPILISPHVQKADKIFYDDNCSL